MSSFPRCNIFPELRMFGSGLNPMGVPNPRILLSNPLVESSLGIAYGSTRATALLWQEKNILRVRLSVVFLHDLAAAHIPCFLRSLLREL